MSRLVGGPFRTFEFGQLALDYLYGQFVLTVNLGKIKEKRQGQSWLFSGL
jgi:hypothetical protein